MAKFLNAKDILNRPDNVTKKELKTVGGWVNVKKHSPADQVRIAEFILEVQASEKGTYLIYDKQALLIELVIVGEDGKTPIFTAEDIAALRTKDEDLWEDLWAIVEEINPAGTKEDVKKAKENLSDPRGKSSDSK